MKNIIFVNHTAKLGGAELSLLDIAKHYKHCSSVLLLSKGEYKSILESNGVTVITQDLDSLLVNIKKDSGVGVLTRRVLSSLASIFKIRKRLSNHDVIYTNTLKSFIISALATSFKKRKIILHLRDALTTEHFSKYAIKIIIIFTHLFNAHVIANSHYTKKCFVNSGGRKDKCKVIWNGINASEWSNTEKDDIEGEKHINVLSLGRISPWKGQHIVIEAIKNLPFVNLRIVGSPNFGEDEYFSTLKTLVKDYGLENQVSFHPFSLDIAAHFKWADIFVHSSTAPEPFGRVIVEAMLSEKIVIATDAGGVKEIINDDTVGILVPVNDHNAIQLAINDVYENTRKYKLIAMQGRDRALNEFTTKRLFENLDEYLNKI